jgi:peroxiredoxin
VVVFHRSAQWCTFCRTQLTHFQEHLGQFEAAGVALMAVSYDHVPHLAEFSAREGIAFPLLSDEGSELIRRLGILNDLIRPDEARYGIPFPGIYALGADGTVLRKYFHQHYRERTAPLAILHDAFRVTPYLAGFPSAERSIEGRSLVVALGDSALVPFQHTPLYIRVTPSGVPVTVEAPGLDVSPPTMRAVEGGTEFEVSLIARALDLPAAEVRVVVDGLEVVVSLPVAGVNRPG